MLFPNFVRISDLKLGDIVRFGEFYYMIKFIAILNKSKSLYKLKFVNYSIEPELQRSHCLEKLN